MGQEDVASKDLRYELRIRCSGGPFSSDNGETARGGTFWCPHWTKGFVEPGCAAVPMQLIAFILVDVVLFIFCYGELKRVMNSKQRRVRTASAFISTEEKKKKETENRMSSHPADGMAWKARRSLGAHYSQSPVLKKKCGAGGGGLVEIEGETQTRQREKRKAEAETFAGKTAVP